MVQDLLQEQQKYKERLNRYRGMNTDNGEETNRPRHGHSQSMILESTGSNELVDGTNQPLPVQTSGVQLEILQRDMELMKERFAKLLLGEDMSGGGKGVSSALALSDAITNLAASVFGEHRKLEPLAPENKARWRKEIDWLLSVTDHIVEFVPSKQTSADGTTMEIMTTRQRGDLLINIPALRKLDTMLSDCLDNFKDKHEFYYVDKDAKESEKGAKRDDKWWLPTVKVPPKGLSDLTKKWLHIQKDSVNQVLKLALAINAQVISEMEIPENYVESLPKNGRATLGDAIYKSITAEHFDPAEFLSSLDLSSEHKILDLKNKIEASVVIWKRKMNNKDSKSSPWGSGVSLEKREIFEERAETILVIIKQQFPGIPQSALDISKIQYNRDVGHAILESYSRILESLAHKVLSQIEDVLYADSLARNPTLVQRKRNPLNGMSRVTSLKFPNPDEELEKLDAAGLAISMTLSDLMDQADSRPREMAPLPPPPPINVEAKKDGFDHLKALKLSNLVIPKKSSYLDNLRGVKSPTARH